MILRAPIPFHRSGFFQASLAVLTHTLFNSVSRDLEECSEADSAVTVKIEQGRPEEIVRMLKNGEIAPEFTALVHTGNEIRLSDLRGRKVWLWFFSSPGGGN